MSDHLCRSDYTPYGFEWCGIKVTRLAEIDARHVIGVKTDKHDINIYVSKTGRSVRVWKDGKELEGWKG